MNKSKPRPIEKVIQIMNAIMSQQFTFTFISLSHIAFGIREAYDPGSAPADPSRVADEPSGRQLPKPTAIRKAPASETANSLTEFSSGHGLPFRTLECTVRGIALSVGSSRRGCCRGTVRRRKPLGLTAASGGRNAAETAAEISAVKLGYSSARVFREPNDIAAHVFTL